MPGYALFALATTLTALLPLGDLGAGAAVVNAMARSRDGDREPLRRAITSGARALMCAGALIAAVGIVPACLGVWTPLLGHTGQPGADSCVAVAFALFGCGLPLGLGKSVLIALNRAHVALMLQGAGSVFALLLLLTAAAVHAPSAAFVASGFLAQCAVGVLCLVLGSRLLGMPLLRLIADSVRRRQPRARIRHLAVPMVVINAGSAVAYATDRLVLSHVADPTNVAVYSAGAQLFAPVIGLISVAGMPLWTLFAHQRESQDEPSRRDLLRLTAHFAAGGLVAAVSVVLLGPTVGTWMMHGRIQVGADLMAAFAALLFVQAINYPVSMWLTDAAGLRFQAVRVSIMAAANLALSIPLARLIGAPGPVIGSVVAFTAAVFVPSLRKALSHA
ncbi:hypothetical protein NGB36_03550 [Streptomyces sp. RB6PN25]|uniref:Polysaccharide biosynthesis protein n=1 Tax=Streptomyces humicola TaxID=2953240 RepID=A0ABT1PPT5_9ACTN|nr:hypothetical protein [Streptomyces humicola]MCQ4079695.1 hypothetical protein [Streptomyces humicola]